MMNLKSLIGLLGVLCILSAGPLAAAEAGASTTLRSRGEEFCFGRTYNSVHMARHKRQHLSALFVFKDFSGDPVSEDKPVTREHATATDKTASDLKVSVVRQYRKSRIHQSESACEATQGGIFDCPAGSEELAEFNLELRANGDALMAKNGLETDGPYRLDRLPLAACRAWRDRARPQWVGKGTPLRVRFVDRVPVCFRLERNLSNDPKQKISSVAVRINRPIEIDPSEKVPFTMFRITASVKLRDGTTSVRNARCDSADYYFWCQYGNGAIRLAAMDDRSIRMFDQADQRVPRKRREMEDFFDLSLGPDDQAFRLTERDDATCELQ